ncbi:hypothetical protein [Methanobrevibacter sp.]|uniref:hypothetical protein n=1 Tax=Methanobrevibacter sp. TaxID=66852 RepID=UPI0025FB9818|nr:hypothetical protein [Methanobrevibacter sp.]MBQ2831526.1 hypothetical protein [Methanobrevibacter sp.]
MTRVYDVFDKFSILNIIIGFALGIYLAFNHNSSNIWFDAIPFILIIGFIMTIPPIVDSMIRKNKSGEKTSINAIIEAFLLNVAMITVCTAFGIVIGSFYIGNYITN